MEMMGQGEQGARAAWSAIEAAADQGMLAFGTTVDGTWQTARFTGEAEAMQRLAPDHSPSWHGLAVSLLHVLVLDQLLTENLGKTPELRYVHLLQEVIEAIAARSCQLAVLVPPATMAHVEQIAGNLEKMPPKSTYFYPKLLSGLVFNPLTGN